MYILIDKLQHNFFANHYGLLVGEGEGSADGGAPAGGGGGGSGEPAALPPEVQAAIDAQLTPLKEQLTAFSQENTTLKAALAESRRQPIVVQQPAETKPEPPKKLTKEEFLARMDQDPDDFLQEYIRERFLPDVQRQIADARRGTREELDSQRQMEQASSQDQAAGREIAGQWEEDSPEQKEFHNLAGQEFVALVRAHGGYRPGDIEQAALRAERKMRASGKSPAPKQAPTGQRDNVRPIVRPGSSPGAGGGRPGEGITVPKTIDDLVTMGKLTATEAEQAKRNNSRWNVSEAAYIKQWLALEAENPNYGTGV